MSFTDEMVCGIKLVEVKEDVLRDHMRSKGIPTEDKLPALVRMLHEYYDSLDTPELDLAQCDVCNGISDAILDCCPFCGDNDGVFYGAILSGDESTDSEIPDPDDSKMEIFKQPLKEVLDPTDDDADSEAGEPDEAMGALVGLQLYKEADLDKALEAIGRDGKRLAESLRLSGVHTYHVAEELDNIANKKLWKLRTKDGKQAYETIQDFCVEELKISYGHMTKLRQIVQNFKLEEFTEYGITRLGYALKVPAPNRTLFLQETKELPTTSASQKGGGQMSEAVKSWRARVGHDPPRAVTPKGEIFTTNLPPVVPPEGRTRQLPPRKGKDPKVVAIIPGLRTVGMWKRPKVLDVHAQEETIPAQSLRDDPWCKLELAQDMDMRINITHNPEGELVCVVDLRPKKPQNGV